MVIQRGNIEEALTDQARQVLFIDRRGMAEQMIGARAEATGQHLCNYRDYLHIRKDEGKIALKLIHSLTHTHFKMKLIE